MKQVSVTEDFLKQALQAHTAMRDWIKAVPDDIQLPAMPGVDGDWLDDVQTALTASLEQPAQEPDAPTPSPVQCKCGSHAQGPQWDSRARGYIVKCTNDDCPAMSQAKTKANAVDAWNRTATKF